MIHDFFIKSSLSRFVNNREDILNLMQEKTYPFCDRCGKAIRNKSDVYLVNCTMFDEEIVCTECFEESKEDGQDEIICCAQCGEFFSSYKLQRASHSGARILCPFCDNPFTTFWENHNPHPEGMNKTSFPLISHAGVRDCPHCGSSRLHLYARDYSELGHHTTTWKVQCDQCGNSTEYFGSCIQAFFIWRILEPKPPKTLP